MQLILNTYGAYLHRTDDVFEVKVGEEKRRISPKKVRSILITTSVSFSSDAIELAVENNIDVVFMNTFGRAFARVWHGKLGSTARIRRVQLEKALSSEGVEIGKKFILQKFSNQIKFLTDLRQRRTRDSSEITRAIETIKSSSDALTGIKGQVEEARGIIMGIEGSAAKVLMSG